MCHMLLALHSYNIPAVENQPQHLPSQRETSNNKLLTRDFTNSTWSRNPKTSAKHREREGTESVC